MNYDLTKFRTGDLGCCFGTSVVDDIIWAGEEIEKIRIQLLATTKIPEHVFIIVVPQSDIEINRRGTKYNLLAKQVYVFEDKVKGCEFGLLSDRYPDTANVVYLEHIIPFSDKALLEIQNRAIEGFVDSFAYGWLNFLAEIPHVITGWTFRRLRLIGSEICSQFGAACTNDGCRADNYVVVDFPHEETTNPLEVFISTKFRVKQ